MDWFLKGCKNDADVDVKHWRRWRGKESRMILFKPFSLSRAAAQYDSLSKERYSGLELYLWGWISDN
jgi:hypothetical protein